MPQFYWFTPLLTTIPSNITQILLPHTKLEPHFLITTSPLLPQETLKSKITAKMAATMATMAVPNAKCMGLSTPRSPSPSKPISLLPLPKGLANPKIASPSSDPSTLAGAAIAGAIFSTLGSVDPALAAQQIAEIAQADNRGLALLLPIVPALGWVLFNILQPALNQLNRMRSEKALVIGLGLGGLAASGLLLSAQQAQASEIAMIAEKAGSDNRGQLLLFVILPAVGWVLFNILQPALNQLNRMRSQ